MAKDNNMPKAKLGKVYPVTYFSNYDNAFRPANGTFNYKGWQFERVARNKVKVLAMPEKDNATSRVGGD